MLLFALFHYGLFSFTSPDHAWRSISCRQAEASVAKCDRFVNAIFPVKLGQGREHGTSASCSLDTSSVHGVKSSLLCRKLTIPRNLILLDFGALRTPLFIILLCCKVHIYFASIFGSLSCRLLNSFLESFMLRNTHNLFFDPYRSGCPPKVVSNCGVSGDLRLRLRIFRHMARPVC